ncbi:MAG: inorganic phosphate transporter [Gemmatimonadetes bacterium]|nr:inorganic phosphate transporter [Gemmatimonadota bacterium]
MMLLLVALTLVVAFANGANDASKGVATLVGSGVTDLRRALRWGTVWTVAGGVVAAFAARGLAEVFSGTGLLTTPPGPEFLAAVAAGSIGWLIIATRTGLPVSTTHSLVGGLVGAALVAQGVGGVNWTGVVAKTALPLAVSPVLSLFLMLVVFPLIGFTFRRANRYCLCLERTDPVVVMSGSAAALATGPSLNVIAGADCPPQVVARLQAMDSLHWLSAGFASFFRGLNDTPKILALGMAAAATTGMGTSGFFALVAVAMGVGSYVAGRRVTETLAGKITRISPDDGFAGNLVTSVLVGLASFLAVPVSTTHVAAGAIIGIGMHQRQVRWTMVRDMGLAWVVTLPVAAIFAGLTYVALTRLG